MIAALLQERRPTSDDPIVASVDDRHVKRTDPRPSKRELVHFVTAHGAEYFGKVELIVPQEMEPKVCRATRVGTCGLPSTTTRRNDPARCCIASEIPPGILPAPRQPPSSRSTCPDCVSASRNRRLRPPGCSRSFRPHRHHCADKVRSAVHDDVSDSRRHKPTRPNGRDLTISTGCLGTARLDCQTRIVYRFDVMGRSARTARGRRSRPLHSFQPRRFR